MKKFYLLLTAMLFCGACVWNSEDIPEENQITQISTIKALMCGVYDGSVSLEKLSQMGNFGIGTYDGLDGEMILMDGTFYQVRSDGGVYCPKVETTKSPFATVVFFQNDKELILPGGLDMEMLKDFIDKTVPSRNLPCAFRVSGVFSTIRTRSVPMQHKPYRPLLEITADQPQFIMNDISGTIIGFRFPDYFGELNAAGYHMHFISSNRRSGGHVLNFKMECGSMKLDVCNSLKVILPMYDPMFNSADLSADMSKAIHKAETTDNSGK